MCVCHLVCISYKYQTFFLTSDEWDLDLHSLGAVWGRHGNRWDTGLFPARDPQKATPRDHRRNRIRDQEICPCDRKYTSLTKVKVM